MALLLLDFVNFRFHSQGTIVEGVGDEVLIGLASTLGLIALVSILYNTQGGPRNIHPSQEEHVQIVRDRLGVGREDGTNPTASEGPVLPDPPPVTYSGDQRCPVCLTETKFHTTTNCGHVFCGRYRRIHFLRSLYMPRYRYDHHQCRPKLIVLIGPWILKII